MQYCAGERPTTGVGFWTCAVLAVCGFLASSPRVFTQTTDQASVPSAQNQEQFQLRVKSNLVVVRVVVRDAKGKPVEGLARQDFRLFDRGKEQSISEFEVVTSIPPPPPSAIYEI